MVNCQNVNWISAKIVREIQEIVHQHTGAKRPEMDRRAGRLRAQGYVPKGGAGRSAPPATPEHAANVLLGFFASVKAMHAEKAVPIFAELRPRPEASYAESYPDFRTALIDLLSRPDTAASCTEVWLCRDQPFAEIRCMEIRPDKAEHMELQFYPPGDGKYGPDGRPGNAIDYGRIPGDLIRDLANALAPDSGEGGA
jgi:hypothetical protein